MFRAFAAKTVASAKVVQSELLEVIQHNSFCTFITYSCEGFCTSHLNLITHDDGNVFFGHLAAANPQAKQLKNGGTAVAIFHANAPQYEEARAIHLHGTIRLIEDEEQLISMMDKLVSKYESVRATPWAPNWQDPKYRIQLKGIVGFNVLPTLIEEATVQRNTPLQDGTARVPTKPPVINIGSSIDLDGITLPQPTSIYTPRYFSEQRPEILEIFIKAQSSCTVITYSQSGPLQIYHLAQTNSVKVKERLLISGQLATSNSVPHLKQDDILNTVLIFNGPHTYISPTLYKSAHSVPTWNYVVAHVHGQLRVVGEQKQGSDHLWHVEIDVTKIDGKYKLNQNRTTEDKLSVVEGLTHSSCASDQAIGELMRPFASK